MAVPDDFGYCVGGYIEYMYINILNLHPSGTQFFLGNVDIFFREKNICQLHSLGG